MSAVRAGTVGASGTPRRKLYFDLVISRDAVNVRRVAAILRGCDNAVAIDCHRQNEAVVVVDVFADDVDAAWGGGDPLRDAAVPLFEAVGRASYELAKKRFRHGGGPS